MFDPYFSNYTDTGELVEPKENNWPDDYEDENK
jgi:hypothetical protein